jgi:hypothetical protein
MQRNHPHAAEFSSEQRAEAKRKLIDAVGLISEGGFGSSALIKRELPHTKIDVFSDVKTRRVYMGLVLFQGPTELSHNVFHYWVEWLLQHEEREIASRIDKDIVLRLYQAGSGPREN